MELEATLGIRLSLASDCTPLLAYTLYKGWKTFRHISFYVITVQLQWCDICALFLDLYIAVPLSLTGYQARIYVNRGASR
ncbi:hypothetical protein COOONC_24483 [Cooperia oncophora]